jgi:hypothetical protein
MYYSTIVSLPLRSLEVFGEECSFVNSISDPTEFLLGGRVLSFSFLCSLRNEDVPCFLKPGGSEEEGLRISLLVY